MNTKAKFSSFYFSLKKVKRNVNPFKIFILLFFLFYSFSSYSQKKEQNWSVDELVPGPSLEDDPAVRKAMKAGALRESQNTIGSSSDLQPTVQYLKYDKADYDKYLKPGEHYGTPEQLDKRVEEAKQQELINIAFIVLGMCIAGLVIHRYMNFVFINK